MRPLFPLTVFTIAALLGMSPAARCAPDATTHPPTLLTALSQAEADSHATLIVDGEKIEPPKGSPPADAHDTVGQVASAYGMADDLFDDVRAIGPAGIFRYNENPADPNPFEDMDPQTILPFLLGNITDDQWRLLTGAAGLGLTDLTTDAQRSLFMALFPKGKVRIAPGYDFSDSPPGMLDFTDRVPAAKLHLGLKSDLIAPVNGQQYGFGGDFAAAGAPPIYHFVQPSSDASSKETLYGIPVRERRTNTLKESDLDWSLGALKTQVLVDGVQTVGELVIRIGWATGLELYADRLLEKKSVALIGSRRTASAEGLLKALAYATAGTYRKVGAAYVLTDNRLGRVVLWRRWYEVETLVGRQRDEMKDALSKRDPETRFVDDLKVVTDDVGVPADQLHNLLHPKQGYPSEITVKYKELSPAQKRDVLRQRDLIAKYVKPTPPASPPVNQDDITVRVNPVVYLTAPGLDGSVPINAILFLNALFPASSTPASPDNAEPAPPAPARRAPESPRAPLAAVIAGIGRRAVLAQPRTPAEVDDLIASMHTIGLNELWLDVFSEGKSHLGASKNSKEPDILTEALRVGPKAGVRVVPALDLYLWGKDAPEAARDRNLHGDDSQEADARQMRIYNDRTEETDDGTRVAPPFPDRLFVQPSSPEVQSTVTALLAHLAAVKGVSDLVWRQTDTPGYRVSDTQNTPEIPDLGYTEDLRLGFLRSAHEDPLDIWPNAFVGIDRYLRKDDTMQVSEFQDTRWRTFRNRAKHDILALLLQSTRAAAGVKALTIFLQQDGYNGGGTGWYGSWDSPQSALPVYHSDAYLAVSPDYRRLGDRLAQAKAQSRIALYVIPPGRDDSAQFLADEITANVKGKPWDGFVLDARRDSIEQRDLASPPANPLAALADGMAK
ncbi:hypothetical protein CCAX7_44710 [Capsulimonas corticalis]|uniref:Uncharacterized protein n=1 Tax=Capsulimonas corticalis TaxID=2219043 RepID=A0A402CX20_9BACT|nr:hypothetical protein [Capsulimonas corticalis]BDI32420.1 hypothetical protein CCAX7_44710 [Capsulimonas corticalis]